MRCLCKVKTTLHSHPQHSHTHTHYNICTYNRACHDNHDVYYKYTGSAYCDCINLGRCSFSGLLPQQLQHSTTTPSSSPGSARGGTASDSSKKDGLSTQFNGRDVYLQSGNGMYLSVADDCNTLTVSPEVSTRAVFVLDREPKSLCFRNVWSQKYLAVNQSGQVELRISPMMTQQIGQGASKRTIVCVDVGIHWEWTDASSKKGKRSFLDEHGYLKHRQSGKWVCCNSAVTDNNTSPLYLSTSSRKSEKERVWIIKVIPNN